jgi:hypothetical protein
VAIGAIGSHVQLSTWLVAKYRQASNHPQATRGPICMTPRLTLDGQQILGYMTWSFVPPEALEGFFAPRQCILIMISAALKAHAGSAFEGRNCCKLVQSLLCLFSVSKKDICCPSSTHEAEGIQIFVDRENVVKQ